MKLKFLLFTFMLALSWTWVLASDLSRIILPEGFKIETYAGDVKNARGMAFGAGGTLFIGSMNEGKVYAVVSKTAKAVVVDEGLHMPVGVAVYKGDLYVAAVDKILKYADIEKNFRNSPEPVVVSAAFPNDTWHGWKFIRFGPDGKLYVPVGAPCNICLREEKIFMSITRMNPDGSGLEIFSHGIRNTVGFDWDPLTGYLWFTENGRDFMGDDMPPDELNCAPEKEMHFGFPFLHGMAIKDPEYYEKMPADLKPVSAAAELGAHVAALGMRFYTGKMFPAQYRNMVFIAEHGSWNRNRKSGYRITMVKIDGTKASEYKVFAEGWKSGEDAWGRPADVEIAPDGALLVSDDRAGAVYRIYYTGKK